MSFIYHTIIGGVLLAASPFIALRMGFDAAFRSDLLARLAGGKSVGPVPGCLWVHAASVGEVRMASLLIAALKKRGETRPIVVSTFTPTGFDQARKEGLDPVFRLPPDFALWTGPLLNRLRPSVLVLLEAELWPGLIDGCRRRGVPVLVANGRVSAKSVGRYGKVPFLFRWIASGVSLFSVRTQTDADRLLGLGVDANKVQVNGNIKFDTLAAAASAVEPSSGGGTGEEVEAGSALIVFGSTRPGDEGPVMEAILKLREKHPALRFVIAPRHIERCREVEDLIREYGMEFRLHSQLDGGEETPFILLDRLGELNRYYSRATLAFVGGGFNPRFGGQNILEPAGYGLPVVFGRHMNNFEEEARLLVESGGGIQIERETELHDALNRLLADPEERRRRGRSARKTVAGNRGAVDKTIELITQLEAGDR